jgi:nucleoporin NUP82
MPSPYVHALECFIAAKQEFLFQEEDFTFAAPSHLSTIYDYQRKYVNALIKQLPPATIFPAPSRPVLMHPPTTVNKQPKRQGPFLLQPSPQILEGSEGADATDITYLAFGSVDDLYNANDSIEDEGETERLGLVLVAFRDGKVDVCIDVEKVEARWESRNVSFSLSSRRISVNLYLGRTAICPCLLCTRRSTWA